MKNIFLITSLIIVCSCNSRTKLPEDILYIFPNEVNNKLSKYLKDNNKENTYLLLENYDSDNFIVYVSYDYNNKHKYYLDNTNRKVFINSRFYPIIFKTDEIFSHPEGRDSILYKIKNEMPIRTIYTIRDNTFNIVFDKNGKIQ